MNPHNINTVTLFPYTKLREKRFLTTTAAIELVRNMRHRNEVQRRGRVILKISWTHGRDTSQTKNFSKEKKRFLTKSRMSKSRAPTSDPMVCSPMLHNLTTRPTSCSCRLNGKSLLFMHQPY